MRIQFGGNKCTQCMNLVFCFDYIIPYIGSVLPFYFGFLIKKFAFLGMQSLSDLVRGTTIFVIRSDFKYPPMGISICINNS